MYNVGKCTAVFGNLCWDNKTFWVDTRYKICRGEKGDCILPVSLSPYNHNMDQEPGKTHFSYFTVYLPKVA